MFLISVKILDGIRHSFRHFFWDAIQNKSRKFLKVYLISSRLPQEFLQKSFSSYSQDLSRYSSRKRSRIHLGFCLSDFFSRIALGIPFGVFFSEFFQDFSRGFVLIFLAKFLHRGFLLEFFINYFLWISFRDTYRWRTFDSDWYPKVRCTFWDSFRDFYRIPSSLPPECIQRFLWDFFRTFCRTSSGIPPEFQIFFSFFTVYFNLC